MAIACKLVGAFAAALIAIAPCGAQDIVKIGLLVPLSGPFSPTGKQLTAGARLYMQQNGDTVAGKLVAEVAQEVWGC